MKNAPNAHMEPYMGVDRSAAVGPVHLDYSGVVATMRAYEAALDKHADT